MFYTIYKIENKKNNKIYIGKHQTDNLDDNYMGSGNLICRAIKKYGVDNFKKEYLHVFKSEEEMNAKEAELVSEEFTNRSDTYNICPGGKGGWGYVNSNMPQKSLRFTGKSWNENQKNNSSFRGHKHSKKTKKQIGISSKTNFLGKKHSEETKTKMRKSKNVGKNNSQYGSMWITNGTENKKIMKEDSIPEGWNRGRI